MFSIGEFSRITGLTIKALRLYHEKGIIEPHVVDPRTGYRYYSHQDAERARVLKLLKDMMLGLDEIAEILKDCSDDADTVGILEGHRRQLESRIDDLRKAKACVDSILRSEREAIAMNEKTSSEIVEKSVPEMRIAGIRWKGRYADTGQYFGRLARAVGRHIAGKPFNMYCDEGYREEDADIESCLPVRDGREVRTPEGVSIRSLAGGKVVSIVHKGPYEQLGRSYEKIAAHLKAQDYRVVAPPREIYLKGPGFIFKGNPKNYLTEIQFPIAE
jgi:DNA-binding transcriptional MerR regulator/DNA gyrase inhibitor GyrI